MKISDIYPAKYLRGSDLGGRAVTVMIEHIVLESFYDPETRQMIKKPVAYFEGKNKGVIISKSLGYRIAEILGNEDMDAWKGKKIVLFTEQKSIFGTVKEVFSARAHDEPG